MSNGPKRPGGKSGSGTGMTGRLLHTKVKSARGRKTSSTNWLQRQLNDPYVAEARTRGLRSRAAFKLMQLDERYKLLKSGDSVVDLGAAPGGWTQVAVDRVGAEKGKGQVLAVDILEMEPMSGAQIMQLDFTEEGADDKVKAALGGPANAVISDMAAPTTGHKQTDHLRIVFMCELALAFAIDVLAPDGVFIAKVLKGGTENDLLEQMKKNFTHVRHAKPEASRADSREAYVIATGFRGKNDAEEDETA
ncbi:RlmE family RNA methyltransferase [Sneathiella sp. CAU 1612]|uniref:Ribosomal RNA large subunit methyltransferase E n=1 Tax=Sneathiella sedimenti TaxID=2816034 RepID=A0ABS3F7N1_9PROT|nr:RlmE family RNA methyltransferase [Sneathiella sedimenti]MBO0334483.1 RlmE family RNA methyltransferase [Sneathiella sedimenti]